jgi:hypothetical protein
MLCRLDIWQRPVDQVKPFRIPWQHEAPAIHTAVYAQFSCHHLECDLLRVETSLDLA